MRRLTRVRTAHIHTLGLLGLPHREIKQQILEHNKPQNKLIWPPNPYLPIFCAVYRGNYHGYCFFYQVPECLGAASERLEVFNDRLICVSPKKPENLGLIQVDSDTLKQETYGETTWNSNWHILWVILSFFGSHLGFLDVLFHHLKQGREVAEQMQADARLLNFRMFYAHFSL